MKIAFLGTGLMGGPMVKNLASAGYDITAWNRTSSKAEFLLQFGVDVKGLAADAVKNADVVVSMLSNGDGSAQMQSDKDLQISLSSNATWIEMGSIKPDESRLHSKKLAELGVNYLDAPVSGGTKGAENGTLAIMVGGQRSVFKKVKNVFAPMGRAVFVGPTGSGQALPIG